MNTRPSMRGRRRLLRILKGGGHKHRRTSIVAGGLTLDMSRMRDVTVDPVARLARVGPLEWKGLGR